MTLWIAQKPSGNPIARAIKTQRSVTRVPVASRASAAAVPGKVIIESIIKNP
jgi:hypothetical protein